MEPWLYEKNWNYGEDDDNKYSYKQNIYRVYVSSSKRMREHSPWLGGRKYTVHEREIILSH